MIFKLSQERAALSEMRLIVPSLRIFWATSDFMTNQRDLSIKKKKLGRQRINVYNVKPLCMVSVMFESA